MKWSFAPVLARVDRAPRGRINMNLILWRHAAADPSAKPAEDLERGLNARGRKQATQVALWLDAHLPAEFIVLTGPSLRTRQTAAALTSDYRVEDVLGVDATSAQIMRVARWPAQRGTVVVVGHQPALGRLASLLLFGSETDVSIKKGAAWWISNRDSEDRAQNVLRAVTAPDLVIATTDGTSQPAAPIVA